MVDKNNIESSIEFAKQDDLSDFFESLIEEEKDIRSKPISSGVINPFEITQCSRRLCYRMRGECFNHSNKRYFESKTQYFLKEKWIEYFSKCRKTRIIDKKVISSDCNYNLTGEIDLVIDSSQDIIAINFHGVSNNDFLVIKNKGAHKKHVIALMILMWMSDLKCGLLVYENKSNQKYLMFHVTIYHPIIESVKKKCLDLLKHKIYGTISERQYKSSDNKECKKCEFLGKCWNNQEKISET